MLQAYTNIDFRELSEFHPPLKQFVFENKSGSYTLDFKNEAANRTLTQALLKRDFGLEITLLSDRLCPPVPNRLNYILWLSNLVKALGVQDHVVGLDIGTGSTAIYPLIGCSIHDTWRFLATDIDTRSLASAEANLARNPVIRKRIQLLPGTQEGPILFPLSPESLARLDVGAESLKRPYVTFSMCNPPFYSDLEDMSRSADNKELDPHAVCTGASVEMITPGGEVGFVRRMIEESIVLGNICGWYTSLLGKRSSLVTLVGVIKEHEVNTGWYAAVSSITQGSPAPEPPIQIDNYAVAELIQGNTRRWIIAWSFLDTRLPDSLARPSSQSLKSIAPTPNVLRHTVSTATLSHQVLQDAILEIPKLRIVELNDPLRIQVEAHEVTWTRAVRRRLARTPEDVKITRTTQLAQKMVCEVTVMDKQIMEGRWVRGRDRAMFETFWGYLSRKLS